MPSFVQYKHSVGESGHQKYFEPGPFKGHCRRQLYSGHSRHLDNFDSFSGETRPTTNACSCEVMNGLLRKCHPSFSISIPSSNPDISSTLSWGRSRVITVAKSTPDIPGIWKSDKRSWISPSK